MKPVKYFLLARLIKLLLQMLIALCVLVLSFNLYLNLFSEKSSIKLFGWTLGHNDIGYNLKARLSINIPDSTYYYKNPQTLNIINNNINYKKKENDTLIDVVINKFRIYANENVSIKNYIGVGDNVTIRAISKNRIHNFFWAFTESVDLIFYALLILILIKLTNRYMDNEIFLPRTFKLVSWLGMLLIINEFIHFIVNYVNMKLIESPVLNTISPIKKIAYYFIKVQLNPASISFTNVGIGFLIVLLSQVLKQAIIAKQEQDLTI